MRDSLENLISGESSRLCFTYDLDILETPETIYKTGIKTENVFIMKEEPPSILDSAILNYLWL